MFRTLTLRQRTENMTCAPLVLGQCVYSQYWSLAKEHSYNHGLYKRSAHTTSASTIGIPGSFLVGSAIELLRISPLAVHASGPGSSLLLRVHRGALQLERRLRWVHKEDDYANFNMWSAVKHKPHFSGW